MTCGDPICRREQHREYLRVHMAQRRREHRKEINEYNRLWMRQKRAEGKTAPIEPKPEPIREDFVADGYADRQKAKTLSMVGRIEV